MALDGVADGPFVAELIELADVMQNRCRQQQVEVEFRIVCRHHLGQPAKADHMFQQPAEIGMVHNLRRGCAPVLCRDRRFVENAGDQLFQRTEMRPAYSSNCAYSFPTSALVCGKKSQRSISSGFARRTWITERCGRFL